MQMPRHSCVRHTCGSILPDRKLRSRSMRLRGLSALCRARHIARLPRKVPAMMGIEHEPALAKCDGDRPCDSAARATQSQILSFEVAVQQRGSDECRFALRALPIRLDRLSRPLSLRPPGILRFHGGQCWMSSAHTRTSMMSPNGTDRPHAGVSHMTGRPGSCGSSLQSRSVA